MDKSVLMKAIPIAVAVVLVACGDSTPPSELATAPAATEPFQVESERFADLRLLRYRAPGFEALDLETKKLLY